MKSMKKRDSYSERWEEKKEADVVEWFVHVKY